MRDALRGEGRDIKIWLLKVIKLERKDNFSFYTAHDGLFLSEYDVERNFWGGRTFGFFNKSKNVKKRCVLMMQHVVFDCPVEDIPAYEAEVAVHSAASAAKERPGTVGVVGEYRVGVLEECDGNWRYAVKGVKSGAAKRNLRIQ